MEGLPNLMMLTMWLPYAMRLAFVIALTLVVSHAASATGSRAWGLLRFAAVIQLLEQLARAYPTYLTTQLSREPSAHMAIGLWNGAATLLMPVIYTLFVYALYELFTEHRRLKGEPPSKPNP